MRRRDALRLFLLSPLTLRPTRLAGAEGATNAVACYRSAIEGLPKWSEGESAVLDAFATTRLDLAAARLVRKGRGALADLARGARAPGCDWLDYWTGPAFADVTWVFSGNLARLALLRARFAFDSGRERAGLRDVSDVLTLAEHFQRGRVFIAQIIGFATEHMAIGAVAAPLPRISPAGLAALSARLDALPLLPIEEAVRGEKDFFLGYARPNDPEVYDDARTDRLLPFYDRLIEAIRSDDEAAVESIRLDPRFDPEDRDGFLDSFIAFRQAHTSVGVKRDLLRTAIRIVSDGPRGLDDVPDPTDGLPFGLRSWSTGFELTTRYALQGKPLATLLVGTR